MVFLNPTGKLNEKYSKIYDEFQTANQTGDTARVSQLRKEAEAVENEMTTLAERIL